MTGGTNLFTLYFCPDELPIPYNRHWQYLIEICNSLMSLEVPLLGTSSDIRELQIPIRYCQWRLLGLAVPRHCYPVGTEIQFSNTLF